MRSVDKSNPIEAAMAWRNGQCYEHRLVLAHALGRPLTAQESVHHKNGDRGDNSVTNLELRASPGHGTGADAIDLAGKWLLEAVPNVLALNDSAPNDHHGASSWRLKRARFLRVGLPLVALRQRV